MTLLRPSLRGIKFSKGGGIPYALGDTITVEDQTFLAIGPTPMTAYNLTNESNGWYRMEARQGERRVEDGVTNVRRIGWDSYNDRLTYGNIYKFSRRVRYSQAALDYSTTKWIADYEMHCGKRSDKPGEYEGSGPVKIMMENGQVRVVLQTPIRDGSDNMTGVTYGYVWRDSVDYHRLVADLEYEWEFEVFFHETIGYLKIWLTERNTSGATVITARTQIVNYTGQLGYGAGRHPYHQERIYAEDSADGPIVLWKKPEHYVQESAPFSPITDTFDGSALPAGWVHVRIQTGTASVVVTGGALTVATGTTPSGSSNRFTRPIPSVIKDDVNHQVL